VRLVTDDQIAAFDFPLRYKLKEVCDTPKLRLRKLTDGESVSPGRPFNAVTFTENHDMGGDEVVNAKMLGYSFILTGDGYPIFWWDYFNLRTCATPYAEWNGCAD
jgi:alpha-amylase